METCNTYCRLDRDRHASSSIRGNFSSHLVLSALSESFLRLALFFRRICRSMLIYLVCFVTLVRRSTPVCSAHVLGCLSYSWRCMCVICKTFGYSPFYFHHFLDDGKHTVMFDYKKRRHASPTRRADHSGLCRSVYSALPQPFGLQCLASFFQRIC